MKDEDKEKLKSAGKIVGKTAKGALKAWFHVSKAMAEDAMGVTFGGSHEQRQVYNVRAHEEMKKAGRAFEETNKSSYTPSASDIPDIDDIK